MSKQIRNKLDALFEEIGRDKKQSSLFLYTDESTDTFHCSVSGAHVNIVELVAAAMVEMEGLEDVIRDAIRIRGMHKSKGKSNLN